MYGSQKTDLVVKYYDLAFGIGGEAEREWYLNKVRSYGGPVLDLACGTGRLALLIAEEGFEVFGIDQSEGMLNQFEEKLREQPAEVKRRISIENRRMPDFDLGRKFHTIICCDAFFHNLTVEDEMGCLQCVLRHLEKDGRFVFNLPNPTCDFILGAESSAGKVFTERGRYLLENEQGSLLVEQAQDGSTLDQTITTTLRLTRLDASGEAVEQSYSSWKSRYLYRYEAVHLLYRCGLEIESLAGDYRDNPVSAGSQLIFQVKPAS